MAKRKRGSNKREPRYSAAATKCVSIMPDGTATFFTPKKPKSRKGITFVDGQAMRFEKEKALM